MRLHVPMAGRDPGEAHRASTPLELFFDLTFVVAVSQAAAALHHGLVDGHAGRALAGFPLVFFAIWWAWMQFTWFASAYDTDDVPYRLAVLVQLSGALVLAAGVPRALDARDFGVCTLGYVMMRMAVVVIMAAAQQPGAGEVHAKPERGYGDGLAVDDGHRREQPQHALVSDLDRDQAENDQAALAVDREAAPGERVETAGCFVRLPPPDLSP